MKNFFQTALTIASFLILVSCSSSESIFRYTQNDTTKFDQKSKYYVSQLDVKISKHPSLFEKDFSKYPDEKKLAEIMKNIFEEKLKEKNIYSPDKKDPNVYEISMNLDYKRRGTLKNNAYVVFVISGDIKISKNGKEIANTSFSDYTRGSFWGEQVVGHRTLYMYGGPEEEIKDLGILFDYFTQEIIILEKTNKK